MTIEILQFLKKKIEINDQHLPQEKTKRKRKLKKINEKKIEKNKRYFQMEGSFVELLFFFLYIYSFFSFIFYFV